MSDLDGLNTRDELLEALRARVEVLLSTTNRAAEEAFAQAQEDARRFAEEQSARYVAATDERVARLSQVSDRLLADAEAIAERTSALAEELGASAAALRHEFGLSQPAGVEDDGVEEDATDSAEHLGSALADAVGGPNREPIPVPYETSDPEQDLAGRGAALFGRFRRHPRREHRSDPIRLTALRIDREADDERS